ncbi:MAG: DUF1294 domain-containing protein [Eubacteriales bacterium]
MIVLGEIYLVIVNVIAFAMYGIDKRKAIKHQYRIPEKQLILIAVLGGSVGAYVGMKTFRHKTKHVKFTLGVPAILIAQVLIIYGVWWLIG